MSLILVFMSQYNAEFEDCFRSQPLGGALTTLSSNDPRICCLYSDQYNANYLSLLHPHRLQSIWAVAWWNVWPPRRWQHFCTYHHISLKTQKTWAAQGLILCLWVNTVNMSNPTLYTGHNEPFYLHFRLTTWSGEVCRVTSDDSAWAKFSLAQARVRIKALCASAPQFSSVLQYGRNLFTVCRQNNLSLFLLASTSTVNHEDLDGQGSRGDHMSPWRRGRWVKTI